MGLLLGEVVGALRQGGAGRALQRQHAGGGLGQLAVEIEQRAQADHPELPGIALAPTERTRSAASQGPEFAFAPMLPEAMPA